MSQEQQAAPARPSRYLRVGIAVRERSVAVASIWLVEQPAARRATFADPMLIRVDVAGTVRVLESQPDPRVSRSVIREGSGHSYGVAEEGILLVPVPFVSVAELADVRIRLTDLTGVALREQDPASLARLIENPVAGMRTVYEIGTADLVAAADWPAVAAQLGIPADAGRFEIYVDRAGEYRWRLRRADGEIVADSGQGYRTREQCEADLAWVRTHAASAPVTSLDVPRPGQPD
jgi:uncharacterized protein YegP (UPF0339 family)